MDKHDPREEKSMDNAASESWSTCSSKMECQRHYFQVIRLITINRAGWSPVLDLLHRLDYVH
jgi:hypothetical protein